MTHAFEQLKDFLREMFQFDEHDLDFGIYKVLRIKRRYIESFIDGNGENDLRAIVTAALAGAQDTSAEAARLWLEALSGRFGDMGRQAWAAVASDPADEDARQRFRKLLDMASDEQRDQAEGHLRTFTQADAASAEHLETKVYNYLLNFFELYYAHGDFGYNARAANAFKVPYEADYDGADTLFHWKHKDSYYIKTGNGFHSVKTDLDGQPLEFRLESSGDESAQATAQNSNKETDVKHYRLARIEHNDGVCQVIFHLAHASTPKTELYPAIWQALFPQADAIDAYLYKKPAAGDDARKPIFNDLTGDYDKTDGGQTKGIGQLRLKRDDYFKELARLGAFKHLGKNACERIGALDNDATANALHRLDRQLNKFYVGNDADYFIHKDLQGFLTREKDRFIKNVVFSDLSALLGATQDATTVLIARAFNDVTTRIIEFLDAIETFQRGLFTLKKKVVDTHYLISVGKIPETFWPRLVANEAQVAEWADLFKVAIERPEQLADHPTLPLDTRHYAHIDPELVDDILADTVFDNLDEQTDGLIFESENLQALDLLADKYREQIKCIYIDPPYNTGGDGFLYKDSFRHSSWASLMADRLDIAHGLLRRDGVLFSSIDEKERHTLERLLMDTFGAGNRVEEIIWAQNTTKNQSPTYSTNHEYIEVYARDLARASADRDMFREPKPGYAEMRELVERLNPDYPSVDVIEDEIATLFTEHKAAFRESLEAQDIEYDSKLDLWRGLYNYKHAEYRDSDGAFVPEANAEKREAAIWIWREGDLAQGAAMGQLKTDTKAPEHPNFRYYQPTHPDGCPLSEDKLPKLGWRFPLNPLQGYSSSFIELDNDHRIVWGNSHTDKVPQIKRFLHEVETNVAQSIAFDYTDGEKEVTHLFGRSKTFLNPKPTTLVERFVEQTTHANEYVLDFFVGSGTTAQSVMRCEQPRRFVIGDMGEHVQSVAIPRVKRVMYSRQWKDGKPVAAGTHNRHEVIKILGLEQYEDVLANLESEWDDSDLPKHVPVKYLFRPEQNRLFATLDLSRPFNQTLRVGKAREEKTIDPMETWCYLQGYWIKSRRVHRVNDRRYLAVETTHERLVVFRDIDTGEDDSDTLNTIAAGYVNDLGEPSVQYLEVNHDAYLGGLTLPVEFVTAADFDRGADWG